MEQLIQGQVIDKYTLIKILGKGGFGEVWEVLDPNSNNKYAMKIFNLIDLESNEKLNLFEDEFYLSTNLNHPNLLIPTQLGKYQNMSFIIMPLCDKSLMDDLKLRMISHANNNIQNSEIYSEKELATILRDVADGLAYLNEVGIIHKDIKPDNILIQENGRNKIYKISDFGISDKFAVSALKRTRMLDIKNDSIAKAYAAPEYFSKKLDPKSDVFSLGVSLYELINGDVPLGNNGMAFGESLDPNQSKLELKNNNQYSRRFIELFLSCLNHNPKLRPSPKNIAIWTEDYLDKGFWPNEMMEQLASLKSTKDDVLVLPSLNKYYKWVAVFFVILFALVLGDLLKSQYFNFKANSYFKSGEVKKASQYYHQAMPTFFSNENIRQKVASTLKITKIYDGISLFYDSFSIANKSNKFTIINQNGDNVLGNLFDEIIYMGNNEFLLRKDSNCSQFSLFKNGRIVNMNSSSLDNNKQTFASIIYKSDNKYNFKPCTNKNISLLK